MRYMADREFQAASFQILAREIFEVVRTKKSIDAGVSAQEG